MFHHDPARVGYSESKAPSSSNLVWSFKTGGRVFSSPAVVDGRLYIGALDGKVYCLNAEDGTLLWSYTTGGAVYSSPAVVYGKVYVGSGDDKVYCLNAENGAYIWSFTADDDVNSSPAVVNGKVYVGSLPKIYCLDAEEGALIWSYTTGGRVDSSPAVVDGKVYVGSYDNNVYCLDAENGSLIWHFTTGNLVYSSPAVVEGKVYVGSYDRKIYCLDAENGSLIWNFTTGDFVYSSPAVAYGKVFLGSKDLKVYCLNAENGALVWDFMTNAGVFSSPAVADGKVYVGSRGNNYGSVYCLDAENGALIWDFTAGGSIFSSPAIAGGKLYVGSFYPNYWVYCFGVTYKVSVSISPSYRHGPPGGMLNYAVTVSNIGGAEDTYVLTVSDNSGWATVLSENLLENVQPGENRVVTLNVAIPENAENCTLDNITVTAASQRDSAVKASESCIAHATWVKAVIYPVADIYAFGGYSRSQLKFDISSIPPGSNIFSAKLWLYRLAADGWDGNLLLDRVDDQVWDEAITASEFDAQTLTDEENHGGKFTSHGWDSLNVLNQLKVDHGVGHAYVSIRLRWADDNGNGPSVGVNDGRFLAIESQSDNLLIVFYSREYDGRDPYLEVTYVPP
jgi:outer membrane protein assembly factor BamB